MQDHYIEITVDGTKLEADIEDVPLSVSWSLEDLTSFDKKKGSEVLELTTFVNNKNSGVINTLHDGNVIDMSPGDDFEKPRKATIKAHGYELLNGKALLKSVVHNLLPVKATWDFYGDNADWVIDLKGTTLKDCVNPRPIVFNHSVVEESWGFDGTHEAKDYVFAPVRYAQPFGTGSDYVGLDEVVTIYDMRPALSIYFMLERAFKGVGYRMESSFLNSSFFRKQTMPWTFGSFLRLDNSVYDLYKFKAATPEAERGTGDCVRNDQSFNRYVNLKVSNDSTAGMFDNGSCYVWNDTQSRMIYTFPSSAPSKVLAGFSVSLVLNWKVTANSDLGIWVEWYINGSMKRNVQLKALNAPAIGKREFIGEVQDYFEPELSPGDIVDVRINMRSFKSGLGKVDSSQYISQFSLDYFKLSINSSISLSTFNKLSNYKFLDLLKGLSKLYDLQFSTDNKRKVVTIEPMFPYETITGSQEGFLKFIPNDFTLKQDFNNDSSLKLKSDFEREWKFAFKEDSSDGALKKMQDRFNSTIGAGKYVLPERFAKGERNFSNDFFSSLMHVRAQQFGSVTGIVPQIPCIFPENISNTSSGESENTFEPKIAYYKGNVTGVGGWKWLDSAGTVQSKNTLPFLFSVNYNEGGEDDPVLSYADQAIDNGSGGLIIAPGLLRKHFLQRMAIYRHGRFYETWAQLKPGDVIGQPFRNIIKIRESLWVLVEINGYQPLKDESTGISLWRWHPVIEGDIQNLFPSNDSVLSDTRTSSFDIKYTRHLILYSDLPK
jgi:hypothetical protein